MKADISNKYPSTLRECDLKVATPLDSNTLLAIYNGHFVDRKY